VELSAANTNVTNKKLTFGQKLKKDFKKNKGLYILIIPVVLFYIIFHYGPIYGAVIAFKQYAPAKGIMGSPWVGFKHFIEFFQSIYFVRLLTNTLTISITELIFGFPAPIILALMINELRNRTYSRLVQTITYMPHFVSMVVVCGMIVQFTKDSGFITQFLGLFGFPQETMLNNPSMFVPIYVISNIWQGVGWGSIIYLAALTGIDQELYEAAKIDGAGKWRQTINITLPCLLPTIIILFILRLGNMLNVGFEKIILLYNPATYETADVISSYVYRKGIQEFSWSFSTAVGLFNSVINFALVISANQISKKTGETSLW
jgi:ABC-type polysaccharide transport system, permease component